MLRFRILLHYTFQRQLGYSCYSTTSFNRRYANAGQTTMGHFSRSEFAIPLNPYIHQNVLLEDQIRGHQCRTMADIQVHFTKIIFRNRLRYTNTFHEAIGSTINMEEQRIMMIKRLYGRKLTWWRVPILWEVFTWRNRQRFMTGGDPEKEAKLPSDCTIVDEFVDVHVDDDGLIDHILMRPVKEADYAALLGRARKKL